MTQNPTGDGHTGIGCEAEFGALLSITRLTEYPASGFIGNRVRAFTSICLPDDLGVVDKAVCAALENKTNWDIDYRLG